MNEWDLIHILQRVEVTTEVDGIKYNFGSKIMRKRNDGISFLMPASQYSSVAFRKGNKVNLTVYTNDKLLNFDAEVLGLEQKAENPWVVVSKPIEKLQVKDKKDSCFLKINVPIEYRLLRNITTPISEFKKSTTESLGGSECSIVLEKEISVDSLVEVKFHLPQKPSFSLIGKVTEVSEIKKGERSKYLVTILYDSRFTKEQDRIIKFIFDTHRSLRKRGMM